MESSNYTNKVLQGAEGLFRRFGIRSVSMDDIAKHLGISKKTIYQEYDDKNQLIDNLVQKDLTRHRITFEEIEKHSKDAIEEIIKIMHYLGSEFAGTNPNMFYDMKKYHHDCWLKFTKFKESDAMSFVVRNLEKGQAQGLYRNNLNLKIIARLRIEEIELALNPSIYPPDKFVIAEVQLELLDHFLHGICTLKGHRLINKYRQIKEEE